MAVWKTFVSSRPVPIDQVFCTRCMLCLLQRWRFQLTALPGQTIVMDISDHNMTDTQKDENTSEVTVTRQTVRFADLIRDAEEIEVD